MHGVVDTTGTTKTNKGNQMVTVELDIARLEPEVKVNLSGPFKDKETKVAKNKNVAEFSFSAYDISELLVLEAACVYWKENTEEAVCSTDTCQTPEHFVLQGQFPFNE